MKTRGLDRGQSMSADDGAQCHLMQTRRQTLFGAGAFAAYPLLFASAGCAAPLKRPSLPVPPLIDARAHNNAIQLIAQTGRHAFFPGRSTPTFGYSGSLLGPVLRMRRGEEVKVTVLNQIDAPTIVHWHGLLIPSDRDGAPHDSIAPGGTWTRVLPIDQPEATAWFHPHPYRDTARQVYFGLAGLVLVEDGIGEQLGLPHTYGEDDIPLILQDRLFGASGNLIYPSGPMSLMQGARGDTIIVNGAIAPISTVPKGMVRLRCLNGSNARNFDLSFSDARTFSIIASDAGYLSAPVATSSLLIAPGERFEILVDFSDGVAVDLLTGADPYAPMMGMMGGRASDRAAILRFTPDGRRAARVKTIPAKLADVPALPPTQGLKRRSFVLNDMSGMMGGGGMMGGLGGSAGFGINGQAFEMARIDAEVTLGSSEVWQVASGMMAHPFHIHGVHFRVLTLDGAPPPAHLAGWKDTILVPRSAELLVRFTQVSSREHPFMFHCHILEHEDAGMMGQYVSA